jgi:DNA-binding transcriptional ArsR family regulator
MDNASSMSLALLQEPERLRTALSPLRRTLLERLREPASATQLAASLGLPRQRVNYHLRQLERVGLVELVETRRRRGCVERVVVAAADAFVVDPSMLGSSPTERQDRYAATHLVATAANLVCDVARQQTEADRQGARLLTFTLETEVGFVAPGDLERFTDELADAVARTAARFNAPGRRYRVVVSGHPAPRTEAA